MPLVSANEFLDTIRASRLLEDDAIAELRARPEAVWNDVSSLAGYACERGWLTAYQAGELSVGRGEQLNVAGYRVFDIIKDGPGGALFKALHPALLQPIALRLVRPEWLGPTDSSAAYLERAQSACLAQSPYLANLLDAGTHGEAPFVVQELVDGCDLFHLVNEMGALPIGLACEYVRQAALAVQSVHERGLVHGDVSPHTILLAPVKRATGSNGAVSIRPRPGATSKLCRFGQTPHRPALGELTFGESDRLGVLAFVPPERLTSGAHTTAGDVYGLGATLYFLLTTRTPHGGESALETMLNIQQAEPAPVETLRSDVPPAVATLVSQLLQRNPYSRPGAASIVAAVQPYCEVIPVVEPEPDVLVATETFTQPGVPTAVPVARDLDHPELAGDNEPFAEPLAEEIPPAPLVEPLSGVHAFDVAAAGQDLKPEIQPLDDHHDAFGHSAMGADRPLAARPKTKASNKNLVWIVAGLCLHLTAVALLIGYLTNWFAFSSTPDPPEQKEEKKDTNRTKGKKRN